MVFIKNIPWNFQSFGKQAYCLFSTLSWQKVLSITFNTNTKKSRTKHKQILMPSTKHEIKPWGKMHVTFYMHFNNIFLQHFTCKKIYIYINRSSINISWTCLNFPEIIARNDIGNEIVIHLLLLFKPLFVPIKANSGNFSHIAATPTKVQGTLAITQKFWKYIL